MMVDKITSLINNLVNIQDPEGEFLFHLDDGRTIDTKGWAYSRILSKQRLPSNIVFSDAGLYFSG